VRLSALPRVDVALFLVFVLVAVFYAWTAGSTFPLAVNGASTNPYNELAHAFLHFHLSVGPAPSALMHLPEPYNPTQNWATQFGPSGNIHDYAFYDGRLFLTWGPAPGLLLAPFNLLGFAPSESLVTACFAVAGFGFALATLRVVLRAIGEPALWLCVLAALTLGLACAVPFILRRPAVYEEEISCGYCFVMAAVWLALSTLLRRRASLWRLIAMSLCFGLAFCSRVDLTLTAVLLLPVYVALRSTRGTRGLLLALTVPAGTCLLLFMAYNYARYGNPLEIGGKYQLAGFDPQLAHYGELGYVAPDAWFYLLSPPRPTILFPFLSLAPPPVSFPLALPAHYEPVPEPTGGLLPMAPILLFLAALPWLWRRRPAVIGSLALPLILWAGAALAILGFVSYEFFSTTERYEVDFSTPLLIGALAAWLALSRHAGGRRRGLIRTGGALLALWSCITGAAVSFVGYNDLLAVKHPHTWASLESAGSPLSTTIARVVGHPVLAGITTPNLAPSDAGYTTLGAGTPSFLLTAGEQAAITIVAPGASHAALVADFEPGTAIAAGASYGLSVSGPNGAGYRRVLPAHGGTVSLPVTLAGGINHLVLRPFASALTSDQSAAIPQLIVEVLHLSLEANS
jgi:hypothetical protein